MAPTAMAAAGAQTARPPDEATAVLIARLATQLHDLDHQIKDTDKLLISRFREHPQAEIIESLPGFGPILGAEFMMTTGGALAGFATFNDIKNMGLLKDKTVSDIPAEGATAPVTTPATPAASQPSP